MRLFAVAYPAMCSLGFSMKIETEEQLLKKARIEQNKLGTRANMKYFDDLDEFLRRSTPGTIISLGDDILATIGDQ